MTKNVDTYIQQARSFMLDGNAARAVDLLKKARACCGDEPHVLALILKDLTAACRSAGRRDEAGLYQRELMGMSQAPDAIDAAPPWKPSMERRAWIMVALALVAVSVGIGGVYWGTRPRVSQPTSLSGKVGDAASAPNEGAATLQCWNSANAIMDEEAEIRMKSMDPGQISAASRNAASKFRELPALNIDPDFASLCAELSKWYDDIAATYEKAAIFDQQAKQVQSYYSSPEAATEAFVRGLLGDPLGKYEEGLASNNSLRQQFQVLRSELDSRLARCRELNLKAAMLRITLSNRYSIPFPDFH